MTLANFFTAWPELFLSAMIFVILVVDAVVAPKHRHWNYLLALATLLGCSALTMLQFALDRPINMFAGMFVGDAMGNVLKLCAYVAVAILSAPRRPAEATPA